MNPKGIKRITKETKSRMSAASKRNRAIRKWSSYPPTKGVACYHKEFGFLKWYGAISDVVKDGFNERAVQNNLSGRTKTSGGLVWEYMEKPPNES
jgi:hypothetical protein